MHHNAVEIILIAGNAVGVIVVENTALAAKSDAPIDG